MGEGVDSLFLAKGVGSVFCRPSGAQNLSIGSLPWGSRPRLGIFRRSAAVLWCGRLGRTMSTAYSVRAERQHKCQAANCEAALARGLGG